MAKITCIADVCIVPIGTGSASVSEYVAAVVHLVSQSHLHYVLHSAGTTIEGPWDEVMALIGSAHELIHDMGVVRIQSDIRVGTRTDKEQTPADKVRVVHERLAKMNEKQI